MVGTKGDEVERELVEGRLRCPECDGELRPWWFARWRVVRGNGAEKRLRPRRSRCRVCARTHVLLPVVLLTRRRDLAEVIGSALLAKACGVGHRCIAVRLGVPPPTVRGWLRRGATRAADIREHFTRLAHALGADVGVVEPRASPLADALEAIGVAGWAAAVRFGPTPVWQFASGATGGRLLANTNSPFPALA